MMLRTVAALLFAACAMTAAAGEPPVVLAKFAFGQGTCANLANRVAVEGQLSGALVNAMTNHFPFLRWTTVAPAVAGAQPPVLTVKLVPVKARNGVAHYLYYYREVRIGEQLVKDRMHSVGAAAAIYESDEEAHPCTDADLVERISKRFTADAKGYAADLGKLFLYEIAISTDLPDVDATEGKLLIVVPWTALHATQDSVISVRVDGQLRALLRPLERHAIAGTDDTIVCAAVEYFVAPPTVPAVKQWVPEIPGALAADRKQRKPVQVLLAQYSLDPDAAKRRPHGRAPARRPTNPE